MLALVVQDGTPIDRLTGVAVQAAMVQAAPKSLPQIASGLRCWHRFAVDVLNMPADVTLPPKHDSHVILYSSIFRNGGTCKNYISSLRFGCRVVGAGFQWDTERLKHAIRGVTKRTAQASKPRRGITRRMLLQVCWHARDEGQAEEALIYAFSFVFLLRVANECLSLQVGSSLESEASMQALPPGRHNLC